MTVHQVTCLPGCEEEPTWLLAFRFDGEMNTVLMCEEHAKKAATALRSRHPLSAHVLVCAEMAHA